MKDGALYKLKPGYNYPPKVKRINNHVHFFNDIQSANTIIIFHENRGYPDTLVVRVPALGHTTLGFP